MRSEQKLVLQTRPLDQGDRFGWAMTSLGDLDGDGVGDFAVGAPYENGPPVNRGAVWIFFMNSDGSVKSERELEVPPGLPAESEFGFSLASLGDLDGDGNTDLAVGTQRNGSNGSVWILFLDADGSLKAQQRLFGSDSFGCSVACPGDLDRDGISDLVVGQERSNVVWIHFLRTDGTARVRQRISATDGGFGGDLDLGDGFGDALAFLGDLDGDGVPELAVGAPGDDDGALDVGAVWILSLGTDGMVLSEQKISATEGGFTGAFFPSNYFGAALAALGDLDGDGITDLAVGAYGTNDGGNGRGAMWVLFLDGDGTVESQQKISDLAGGFGGVLADSDSFGIALGALGDVDGDGFTDLAVGSADEYGGFQAGAVWILFLQSDGTVRSEQKIGDVVDHFGASLAGLGDLDGDGHVDLAVGALGVDGGVDPGAVWIQFLAADGSLVSRRELGANAGGFAGALDDHDRFGTSIASLGDLDGDGNLDLAVGAVGDDDGGVDQGAVWILFLEADGTVRSELKLSETAGGFQGVLAPGDGFGSSLACLGDLDGDGNPELAVGSSGDDGGGSNQGAVWILFLDADGSVKVERRIGESAGGFVGILDPGDAFGSALAAPGDLDSDGIRELVVGARNDDDGSVDRGAVWVLFLEASGNVRSTRKISATTGGFGGVLDPRDHFGSALAALGDLDADGFLDLSVGADGDDDGSTNQGALWILSLAADGTVLLERKISATTGGFGGALDDDDHFGNSLAALGDLDGDGVTELVVGALQDDDVDLDHGAVWILFLKGALQLGFETEDDFATVLVNGQDLSSPPEFARLVSLSSSGPNAGAAIFDSTPGGPNDPSQDHDLLVASGHVLILQTDANTTQTVPGVFDRPNDDEDGGLLAFSFSEPVAPQRIDLIDIDAGSDEATSVLLTDDSGLTRVYMVPPDWTGDLLAGGPGRLTLDLTRLDPQPGLASLATAGESPGFDAIAVVRIEVALGSSGAVDRLAWCPNGPASVRSGPRARRH